MDNLSLFKMALDALGQPLFVLDEERRCIFANQVFYSFFRLSPQQGVGEIETSAFWPAIDRASLSVTELVCQFELERGEIYSVKLALAPLQGGCTLCRVLAGLSHSDTLHSLHSQRLETLGMLASGVAHDFNNILAGILGHVGYLKTILPPRGPHIESLSAVEDGAKRATSMIQQILNFSKLELEENLLEVNVGELIARTGSLLRGAISADYNLLHKLPEKPVHVLAAEGKLAQVLINLVINARDAIKPGGRIEIGVREVSDPGVLERIFGLGELPCACYACVSVVDDGHGMPKEVMQRMFEPYYSTKHEKGTGLGLATVAAIVQQLGGAIEVQSELGRGTEVNVYLPVVEFESSAHATDGSLPRALQTGTEHVLIVDDEYPVRNVLQISLQHLGYRVETAASGPEALEKYIASKDLFDLVILDMLMPQLSGEKVFFRLREINPHARVLLISGYASESAVNNVLRNGGLDFIQKPFTIEELSHRVRDCIDKNPLAPE